MKRKLLFAAILIAGALGQLRAQKSNLTPEKGWTKITEFPGTLKDYFFAIYTHSDDFAMKYGAGNDGQQGNYTMKYSANTDANETTAALWKLENWESNFTFRSIDNDTRTLQTEWNAAWYMHTNDQPDPCQWSQINAAYSLEDAAWIFKNGQYPGWTDLGPYIGPWASVVDGGDIAANKAEAGKTLFDIFSITRGRWVQNVASEATEGSPVEITKVLDNPEAERRVNGQGNLNGLGGWTITGSGLAVQKNNSYGSSQTWYFQNWVSSGTIPNSSMSQTINNLPNGKYRVTVNGAFGGSGCSVFANNAETAFGSDVLDYSVETVITNGTLTIGVKSVNATSTYLRFDRFRLYYLGVDLSALREALQDQIDAVADLEGNTTTAAYNNAKSYADGINVASLMTEEAISAASTELGNRVSAAEALVANYTRYKNIRTAVLAINAGINVSSMDTAVEAATTNDGINAAVASLRSALTTYLAGAGIEDDEIDLTAALLDNAVPGTSKTVEYWTNSQAPSWEADLYEFYNASNAYSKQAIATELPIGYYKMTVIGYTRDESYNGYIFAGTNKQTLAGAPRATVNNRSQGNTWIAAGNGVNEMTFELASATSNLEIGINSGNVGDKWTCWRSFKLEYLGTAPLNVFKGMVQDAIDDARTTVAALEVPTGVKNTFATVADAQEAAIAGFTTVAECETSIAAVEVAVATAQTAVAPTAMNSTILEKAVTTAALPELDDADETVLQAVIDGNSAALNACTNVSAIETQNAALWAAIGVAINTIELTGTDELDLTYLMTNPDLSTCTAWQKADGWYTDQAQPVQNSQVMNNESVANSEDPSKYWMYEYWSNNTEATSGFVVYQKVVLPEGTYKMDALCLAGYGSGSRYSSGQNITFSANDVDGALITTTTLEPNSIEFVQGSAGEVKIGLKAHAGNTSNWMGIGYATLIKTAPKSIEMSEDVAYTPESKAGTVELTKTIYSGFNTLVLPFGVDAATVTAQFGEGTLYKFTDADAGLLNFESATSIVAHTPYLFKSTAGTGVQDTYTFEGVTISTGTPITAGTDYNFVGTYTPYAKGESPIIEGSDYVLGNDNCFHLTTVKNALKAFRAYIQANEPSGDVKQALIINIDGEATAIESVNGEDVTNIGGIYNLAGQRVSKAQKGLYIINGKKALVK